MREEAEQEQASQNQSPSGKTETATSIGHGEEEVGLAYAREADRAIQSDRGGVIYRATAPKA